MPDPVTPEEARRLADSPWEPAAMAGALESLAAQLEAAQEGLQMQQECYEAQLEAADKSLVHERLRYHEQKQRAEAAQKVIEAARELDWDSYAEEQGKPEVDLSGLWDSLAAYDEQVKP